MALKQITKDEYHRRQAAPFDLWIFEIRHQKDCAVFSGSCNCDVEYWISI